MVWCEGNEFVSTLKQRGKHYQCTGYDFESSETYKFHMTMLSRQKLVDTIFSLGWMYLYDFYTIFRNVILSTYIQGF